MGKKPFLLADGKTFTLLSAQLVKNYRELESPVPLLLFFAGPAGGGKTYAAKEMGYRLQDEGMVIYSYQFAAPLKHITCRVFGITKFGNPINSLLPELKEFKEQALHLLITGRLLKEWPDLAKAVSKDEDKQKRLAQIITELLEPYTKILEECKSFFEKGFYCAKAREFVRLALQKLGTEVGRELISGDYWVRQAAEFVGSVQAHCDIIVISDLRFPNELQLSNLLGLPRVLFVALPPDFNLKEYKERKERGELHESEAYVDKMIEEADFILVRPPSP